MGAVGGLLRFGVILAKLRPKAHRLLMLVSMWDSQASLRSQRERRSKIHGSCVRAKSYSRRGSVHSNERSVDRRLVCEPRLLWRKLTNRFETGGSTSYGSWQRYSLLSTTWCRLRS